MKKNNSFIFKREFFVSRILLLDKTRIQVPKARNEKNLSANCLSREPIQIKEILFKGLKVKYVFIIAFSLLQDPLPLRLKKHSKEGNNDSRNRDYTLLMMSFPILLSGFLLLIYTRPNCVPFSMNNESRHKHKKYKGTVVNRYFCFITTVLLTNHFH